MDSSFWRRSGRLWVQGAALLALRLWQNHSGFDPDTGLGVPNFPGTALVVLLVLFAAAELVLARRLPKRRSAYADQFAPPDRSLMAAVAGCMLLAAGGVALLLGALTARSVIDAAAGLLGVAAGGGLLLHLRQARAGAELMVLPVLPAMFFGVFFVLDVYIPTESDPVLARSYLTVLAAALAAYAFAQLGGFLRKESSQRWFVPTADLAVPLCLAAMADGGMARGLLYAGCALLLTIFLTLRREARPRRRRRGPTSRPTDQRTQSQLRRAREQ